MQHNMKYKYIVYFMKQASWKTIQSASKSQLYLLYELNILIFFIHFYSNIKIRKFFKSLSVAYSLINYSQNGIFI